MSNRLYVGTRKGLFVFDRGNSGWSFSDVHFIGDQVPMFLADDRDGRWYTARKTDHFGQKLFRSDNAGKDWAEVAVPKYADGEFLSGPPKPDGCAPDSQPASLSLIWELAAGGSDQPGVLWAGTVPGGLFRSTDGGDSWELVRGLWDQPERSQWFGGGMDEPGIHSVCVDPRNSDRVVVAVSCGGVWVTEDGGETWACKADGMRAEYMPPDRQFDPVIQDPHRLVQCRDAPDAMWVQHHNGVFRSSDCSESWREIEDPGVSAFGFGVAVHPHDGNTAWFAPGVQDSCRVPVDAKLVVTRTKDGGETFDELRNGLPQEHCYDIVFRHALAVDETGDRLAIGSSTGGLWITEDGGDVWDCLSTTLPQVYCVRFGRSGV
ncbi:MAG: WD40/YVTN/BNR-like repeat-containing protein [Planctomycetaceae bacterium]